MLKILLQFRTFGVVSVEKQWGRGVAIRGGGGFGAVRMAMTTLGAMSFAVPIHAARVQLRMVGMTRSQRDKYADKNLTVAALAKATINYASSSGLLSDAIDGAGGFASSWGGDTVDEWTAGAGIRGQGQGKLLGGVVAPAAGAVEDLWAGAHGDWGRGMRMLPGAGLPFAQPLFNLANPD